MPTTTTTTPVTNNMNNEDNNSNEDQGVGLLHFGMPPDGTSTTNDNYFPDHDDDSGSHTLSHRDDPIDEDNESIDDNANASPRKPSIDAPKIDFVFDVTEVTRGHAFGEEAESYGSASLSAPSASSSSDGSSPPPPPPPKRVTRASNKAPAGASSTAQDEVSPENISVDIFRRHFFGSDPQINGGQQEANSIGGNVGQTADHHNTDPLWNILSEEIKSKVAEDRSMKVNFNLYKFYQQGGKDGFVNARLNKKEEHQLLLLKMCIDAKVPLFVYDNILKWAEAAHADGYFERKHGSYKKRKKLITFLSKRVFLQSFEPRKSVVSLPYAGINLAVTYFDAEQAILSLLMDKDLMRKENLNFLPGAGESIFASPNMFNPTVDGDHLDDNHVFDDFYSGSLVHTVHKTRVKIPGHETFIPLIFFIDKTHIDRHGRLCQEPICFTLGLFNRKTRAKPCAWRVLGYIPNQSMHVTAKKPVEKLGDYHVVQQHIFEMSGLVDLMKGGGTYWKFDEVATEGNREGLLHFYFGTLLGDSEGHDKASGHYLNRTHHVPMLCRKCDTPYSETDNPYFSHKYLTRGQITNSKHINREERDKSDGKRYCNQVGFHYLPHGNAFDCLDFGLKDGFDHVSQRTAYDIQHAIRMGNESRAINGFRTLIHRKNARPTAKKQKNKLSNDEMVIQREMEELNALPDLVEDDDGQGTGGVILVGDTTPGEMASAITPTGTSVSGATCTNKKFVFSRIPKHVSEKAMLIWGTLLSQQSDRGLPRTYFPQGALSTDKLNCHEYPGLLLLYSLLLVSTIGIQFTGSKDQKVERDTFKRQGWLGDKHRHQWLRVLERLFLHDAFIHSDSMTKGDVVLYEWYVHRYLTKIKLVVNRKEGARFCFLKFHMNVHIPGDIIKYSVPNNTDTEVGESNHKDITKKTAARTQLRSKQLDWQTAHRYWENLVVALCVGRFLALQPGRKKETPISPLPRGFTHCFGREGLFAIPKGKKIVETSFVEQTDLNSGIFLLKKGENTEDDVSVLDSVGSKSDDDSEQEPRPKKQKKDFGPIEKAFWTDDQGKTGKTPGVSLQAILENFLTKTVSPACERRLLRLANEVKIDGVIYRASPGRTAQRSHNSGWNDWAYAYWPWEVVPRIPIQKTSDGRRPAKTQRKKEQITEPVDDGKLATGKKLGEAALNANGRLAPVHLLCFVELRGLRMGGPPLEVNGNKITKDGTYAICHAVTQLPPEKVPHSLLFSYAIKDIDKDNIQDNYTDRAMKMYMIPVDNIKKPCICIPDMAGPRRGNDRSYKDCMPLRATNFLVAPSSEWTAIFLQHMRDKKRRVEEPNGYQDWPEDVIEMERERREKNDLDDPTGYDSDDDPGSDYEVD